MNQLTYLLVKVNQTISITSADGIIAKKALSASLPLTMRGNATKAKNDVNIALRIILERNDEVMKFAAFVFNEFVSFPSSRYYFYKSR